MFSATSCSRGARGLVLAHAFNCEQLVVVYSYIRSLYSEGFSTTSCVRIQANTRQIQTISSQTRFSESQKDSVDHNLYKIHL